MCWRDIVRMGDKAHVIIAYANSNPKEPVYITDFDATLSDFEIHELAWDYLQELNSYLK